MSIRLAIRYPLSVFYDASCAMCASEMNALKARDFTGMLQLVDCSAPEFSDEGFLAEGITRTALMARMHVRDASGQWFVAMDAFEVVYRAAGLERAASLWGDRRWRPFFDRLYPWIARYRQPLSRLGLAALVGRVIPKPTSASSSRQGEFCQRR